MIRGRGMGCCYLSLHVYSDVYVFQRHLDGMVDVYVCFLMLVFRCFFVFLFDLQHVLARKWMMVLFGYLVTLKCFECTSVC